MQEKLEKKKTEEMQFSSCDIFFWLNPNLEALQLEQIDQILVLRISKAYWVKKILNDNSYFLAHIFSRKVLI